MVHLGYILVSCFAFVIFANAQKFPSDIHRCAYMDEKCLKSSVQDVLRQHSKGHQGLNIIPLDPLHVTTLNFKKIPNSPVSVDLKMKDVNLTGISRGSVSKVAGFEKDPANIEFELEIDVPRIVLTGFYEISGEVVSLPISGKGKCSIIFDNLIIAAKARTNTNTQGSAKYLNIQNVNMNIEPRRVRFNFDNLFDGDTNLGDKMNDFLNDNWDVVYNALEPLVNEALAKIMLQIANGPFSKIPYSELFLPF